MNTTNITTPTQITDPWAAARRTIVQTIAGSVLTFASVAAGLAVLAPQFLDAIVDVLPADWVVYVTATVGFISAISGATARIMAIPGVNDWLKKLRLGIERQ